MRGIILLVLAQIRYRQIRQQIDKAALRLRDKRISVSEKQDVFYPTVVEQHLAQRDHRARFAGACRHDDQRLAAVFFQRIAYRFHGGVLIIPSGDIFIHIHIFQACPDGLQVKQFFQIALGIERGNAALGINIVLNARIKAVGEENHRSPAVLFFENIRIERGLLSADGRILAGLFGFDHGKRSAVVTVEHIVSKADNGMIRHTAQLHLVLPILALYPTGVLQHSVNIELARFIFGSVERLGIVGLPLFGARSGQLVAQRLVFLYQLLQIDGLFGDIRQRFLGGEPEQAGIKVRLLIVAVVAAGDKIHKVKQIFNAQLNLFQVEPAVAVRCLIADAPDVVNARHQAVVYQITEFARRDKHRQRVLIGHAQVGVNGIHPFYGKLQRPAAVERTRRKVDM